MVVVAPLEFEPEHRKDVVRQLLKSGYYRIWMNDEVGDLNEIDLGDLARFEILVDRFVVGEEGRSRLTEALEQAFSLSRGLVTLIEKTEDGWIRHHYSSRLACNRCGREAMEPVPQLFSFNSPLGACSECQGYGRVIGVDLGKVIPDRSRTLRERPIDPWNSPGYEDSYDDLEDASGKYAIPMDVPIAELTDKQWKPALRGTWKVVRHPRFLRLAGEQEIQGARPGQAGEVSLLRQVPRLRRLAPAPGGAAGSVSCKDRRGSFRDECC